jgi:ferredoxin
MPPYKIVYNKAECIGAGACVGVHPDLWSLDDEAKAILRDATLNQATDRYELIVDESDFRRVKDSAIVCPVYAIDIIDLATQTSILDIAPTAEREKETARVIESSYDSEKEWVMDSTGFVTIKPFPEQGLIKVRCYTPKHELLYVVQGRHAEEIYNTMVRLKVVTSLTHAAYLGSELQKAEIAMRFRLEYVQDDPLQPAKAPQLSSQTPS